MPILENILTITGIIGLVYSLFQWLYYHQIRFFLWFNKFFSWHKDVNFELTILSKESTYEIGKISRFIREKTKNKSKIISSSNDFIVFSLDMLIIQIRKDEFDEDYPIEILVTNNNSTYKAAKKNLHALGLILDDMKIENVFAADKYQFVSAFKKRNPFIGPSVSTIKVNNIKNFFMVLSSEMFEKEGLSNHNDIQIGLNKINYVDTNFSEIKLVADVILSL